MSLKDQKVETKEKKAEVVEDKATDKATDKASSKKSAVAKSFAKLDPKERSELYAELREAVATDNDFLSQGKDPGSDHYNSF